jgi:hypothetical protein
MHAGIFLFNFIVSKREKEFFEYKWKSSMKNELEDKDAHR